jgi:hypothetical protein
MLVAAPIMILGAGDAAAGSFEGGDAPRGQRCKLLITDRSAIFGWPANRLTYSSEPSFPDTSWGR